MHGAIYLQLRTEGAVLRRAATAGRIAGSVFIVTFAGAGVWLVMGIEGYAITAMPPANSPFMPLAKTVAHGPGSWLRGAPLHPWTVIVPLVAIAAALLALAASRRRAMLAFVLSSTRSFASC